MTLPAGTHVRWAYDLPACTPARPTGVVLGPSRVANYVVVQFDTPVIYPSEDDPESSYEICSARVDALEILGQPTTDPEP